MGNESSKDVFRSLSLSPEQFESWLKQVCLSNNIPMPSKSIKNNGKEIHYKVLNGLIRVYITKKGLTVDLSVCADERLKGILATRLEVFKNGIDFVQNKSYTYKNRTEDEIESVIKNIEDYFGKKEEEYSFSRRQEVEKDVIQIVDRKSNEKVVISCFRTGTIMIQGLCYILWQDVARVIEESLNDFSINDTINRILLKEEVREETDFQDYLNEIALLVGEEAFQYLEEIDKTYLTSCCYLVKNKIILPEYSAILMPLSKAFEGYFRKLVYDLNFYENARTDKFWKIGHIFNRGKESMKDKYKDKINNPEIVGELERLYKLIKLRDDICHSGVPTFIYVDEFDDAQKYYEDVLSTIRSSYDVLKKFI